MAKCKHSWAVDRWPGPMVWIEKCSECGEEKTIDRETGRRLKVPAPLAVDPQELKDYRAGLKYTQAEMAVVLCTPLSTYQKWEQGVQRIPGVVGVAINSLPFFSI